MVRANEGSQLFLEWFKLRVGSQQLSGSFTNSKELLIPEMYPGEGKKGCS